MTECGHLATLLDVFLTWQAVNWLHCCLTHLHDALANVMHGATLSVHGSISNSLLQHVARFVAML